MIYQLVFLEKYSIGLRADQRIWSRSSTWYSHPSMMDWSRDETWSHLKLTSCFSFHDGWWEIIGGVILITLVFEKQDVFSITSLIYSEASAAFLTSRSDIFMLLLSSLEVSAITQPLRHGALFRWFYHFSDLNQFFSSQNTVLFLPWRDDNRFLCLDRDWPSHLCRPPQHRLSLCSPPPGQILGGLWVSHKILLLLWAHHLRRALWPRPCKEQVYRARRHLTVDYFHHYGIVPEYAFLSLTLIPPPTLQTGEHSLPPTSLLVQTTPLPSPSKMLTPKLNFRVPVSGEAKSFIWCLAALNLLHRLTTQGVLHDHRLNTADTNTTNTPSRINLSPTLKQNSSPRTKWHDAWPESGPQTSWATLLLLWVEWTRKVVTDGIIYIQIHVSSIKYH